MAITDRNLKPGTQLVARYKGEDHYCLVVDEGRFFLQADIKDTTPADDRLFRSLSTAGAKVTGSATNGWRFWSVMGEEPARRATAAEKRPAGSSRTPKTRKGGSAGSRRSKPEAKIGGARQAAARASRQAPARTAEPEPGDYLLDGDGRPAKDGDGNDLIYGGETPIGVEAEATAE